MKYFVLFLLTCFVLIISFNLKAIECPKEPIDSTLEGTIENLVSENSENLQPNKKWEDLTQEEKDICTKKSEEVLEEFKEQQKYKKYTSLPGAIFLTGIFITIGLLVILAFNLLRYFLRRSQ